MSNKYQFCIRFLNTTTNSAATKAIIDCNNIFSAAGYKDYTVTVWDNANRAKYFPHLFSQLLKFYRSIQRGSTVIIQYPLLSINNVFGPYFIRLLRMKKVKFYCVVHDIESLRTGGKDKAAIDKEISNLNYYDAVIVHNPSMLSWLKEHGVTTRMIPLMLFDYLVQTPANAAAPRPFSPKIVFAGNLAKSNFIYKVKEINWDFNVYGPNFKPEQSLNGNLVWRGEFSAEEVVHKMEGSFGLIWDGEKIDSFDEVLGNYLKFNNPHKCSLYLAAGLPVIVPRQSAIAAFVQANNVGLLIDNLYDLNNFRVDEASYATMQQNVLKVRDLITGGAYLQQALQAAENAGH
ncbi:hypothetical protein [Deminuibacter soli]|uniref:Beta-1,6-galactofuranosyltransferase n=1 Tax=Deminuibacter soli TaxID=2291815 RepID=A0A3E1NFM0_9BACT|nr:hypothetical protein [Deminuibacter soli]RFM26672.1 hypothetical protein DXN05_19070 [Deminuibacter soli]